MIAKKPGINLIVFVCFLFLVFYNAVTNFNWVPGSAQQTNAIKVRVRCKNVRKVV